MLTAIVILSIVLEAVAVVSAVAENRRIALIMMAVDVVVLMCVSVSYGFPFRTQTDKCLWYAFSLSAIAFVLYCFRTDRWMLVLFFVPVSVFAVKACFGQSVLMAPALRNGWLLPHVVFYASSYLLLSESFVISVIGFYKSKTEELLFGYSLHLGFVFYSLALLVGMIWAKQAWGCFWSFDPKETWSLATWILLLVADGLAERRSKRTVWVLWLAYVCLHVCWWGVNHMPWAASGLHVY